VAMAAALLPPAIRAIRGIPTFMLIAAPAMSRLTSRHLTGEASRTPSDRVALTRSVVVAVAAIGAIGLVVSAWSRPWTPLGWTPISPTAARAVQSCRGPLYNFYGDGGVLVWFAPAQKVFLDSRQDPFPTTVVQEATRVEATGDYRPLFARYQFNCAAVRPDSAVARALSRDKWKPMFADARWMVLTRPQ
jgi:hypothetical protein